MPNNRVDARGGVPSPDIVGQSTMSRRTLLRRGAKAGLAVTGAGSLIAFMGGCDLTSSSKNGGTTTVDGITFPPQDSICGRDFHIDVYKGVDKTDGEYREVVVSERKPDCSADSSQAPGEEIWFWKKDNYQVPPGVEGLNIIPEPNGCQITVSFDYKGNDKITEICP